MAEKDAQLRKHLARLREGGEESRDVDQDLLAMIYGHLPKEGSYHWFCPRAQDDLVRECAKFCLRMFAYSGTKAAEWKDRVFNCLHHCADCVVHFQEAKGETRQTYFAVFPERTMLTFYATFMAWESEMILKRLNDTLALQDTLDREPALVYYMLSDLSMAKNEKMLQHIRTQCPKEPIQGWPTDIPPAGLFLLLSDVDSSVRGWASQQLATFKRTPMPAARFIMFHQEALAIAMRQISERGAEELHDPRVLWAALSTFLRYVPPEFMKDPVKMLVSEHLSDSGLHFIEVLKSFLLLLDRLGPKYWEGKSDDTAALTFNIIKDNKVYGETLRKLSPNKGLWQLQWIEAFVKSLGSAALSNVFPLIMQFLCEQLQHELYDTVRPTAMLIAARIFEIVLASRKDGALQELDTVMQTLDIHAGSIVSVAFKSPYTDPRWEEARTAARKLVNVAINADVAAIRSTAASLTRPSHPEAIVSVAKIRQGLWHDMYEAIRPTDSDALPGIFDAIAALAHMDHLLSDAYTEIFEPPHREDAQKALQAVNIALDVFREGYADTISRHLDFSSESQARDLLRRPGVVKNITVMIFSPVEKVREPAQSIVGVAFDTEERLDCLRALLQNFPKTAIEGMMYVLETFAQYAASVPEACSVSKSLALCFTDVIDVLCASPNGLLLQTKFLRSIDAPGPDVLLPKWWSLMAKALVVIFQRTPRWAAFFENEDMVTWMRDALIFGRDMLAQRKVIEGAALALAPQTSSKRHISETGKRMVGDLQTVLYELTRWLRLTDEELLHQAFAFLQSLLVCFKETRIPPQPFTLDKLQRHIDGARDGDKRKQTRLDSARLDRLQETISSFAESDDDVQIVAPPARRASASVKVDEDEVQIVPQKVAKKPEWPIGYHKAAESKKGFRPTPDSRLVKHKGPVQQTLQLPPRIPAPTVQRRPVRPPLGSDFTKDDQTKLQSASSVPKFKLSKPTPTATSAPAPPPEVELPDVKWEKASTASSAAGPDTSDSSSESDDEGGATLEDLVRRPAAPKKPVERRRVIMMDMPTTSRNSAIERVSRKEEARRVALRLKPDISSLHRTILSWDYEHSGPEPPGPKLELIRVPDKFSDVQQYRRVFEPLLLMECWAQIAQSKDAPVDSYQCQISNRQYTDEWIDMDITINDALPKDYSLMDTDIVLLRNTEGTKRYMAKAQFYKNGRDGVQATLRLRLGDNDHGPQSGTAWMLSKVFSLTTLHREYAALMGLPYFDLCGTILKADLGRPSTADHQSVKQTMTTYSLNEPQAKAVTSALKTDGFSLIQGPPGTGKTSTICGLIQAYLARRARPATAVFVGRTAKPMEKEQPKKILLCAPSNAAIDEITFRLKEGVSGPGKRVTPPKVVRVGAPKSMNISVKDVSLDALVEQKVNEDPSAKVSLKDSGNEMTRLRTELESVKRLRQQKLDEMAAIHDNTAKTLALEDEVRKLNKHRAGLTHQLDQMRDKQKSDFRAMDAISRKFRAEVLFEADVICSTLAGAGHELLESYDFEMVVIDEAAQAIELSSLIPLKYRCNRCVMVGDPQQLPPTVISQEASKYGCNQSLFVRLQRQRPDAVHLLSIQYRMHPQISLLPSRLFYDGRLIDGPDMAPKTQRPWHVNPKFGEYRFYNVQGAEQSNSSKSLFNQSEIQVAMALFNRLRQEYSSYDFDFKIGIVTMYRAQVIELRRAFIGRFGAAITSVVDFNTVDGFQGQEKEIIILSCVRSGPSLSTVGFLSDVRRMNVALTRAKSSVFVLGNAATLERSDVNWRRIVVDARERSRLVDADVGYFTASKLASSKPVHASKPRPVQKASDPPLPVLATPRQLAASASRPPVPKSSDRIAHEFVPRSPILPVTTLPTTSTATPTENAHAGQKRRAEEENPPSRPQPSHQQRPANGDGEKQGPRPTKKPKQKQGPSLFIPKKRPPPNDGAGPSANRRRM